MTEPNIIGHIIGIDEIHKKKLVNKLPTEICVIDLDKLQQIVYNCAEINNQKKEWEKITTQILVLKKQCNYTKQAGSKCDILESDIKKLIVKRKLIKTKLYDVWKTKMNDHINKILKNNIDKQILFLGFNVYPKDYRVRINLEIASYPKKSGIINKIIFDTPAEKFASDQIKYYLSNYSDRIVRGVFPLKMLEHKYISSKYEKFANYYLKLDYKLVPYEKLFDTIKNINVKKLNVNLEYLYVPTVFKSGDTIIADTKNPIQGFRSIEEAKTYIKQKIRKNDPIYIYTVPVKNFQLIDGKYIATTVIYPVFEDSQFVS